MGEHLTGALPSCLPACAGSFASAPIPVGIKDPLQRLKTVHESLQVFKDSPIVVVQNIFESIVGNRLPWKVRMW